MMTALWISNLLLSTASIPVIQIVIVAFLYCGYSYLISTLMLKFWDGDLKQRVVTLLCYSLIIITVIPFIQILVYEVLPLVDIVFFDDSLPKNMPKFYFRIISGFLITNFLALIVTVIARYFQIKQRNRKLDRDFITYRDRAVGMQYTSHFLTSIFLTQFGEMLINDAPKDKAEKLDIIQFLAYLMEVERPGGSKTWAEEMDQLHCFVRLLRRHYGDNAILYSEVFADHNFPAISSGVLFFPLENCLKHAHISTDRPIDYRLVVNKQEIVLTCQNYWSPKDPMFTSRTGFEMLRYKLGQMEGETVLDINRTEDTFFVRLQLNLDLNEKAEL